MHQEINLNDAAAYAASLFADGEALGIAARRLGEAGEEIVTVNVRTDFYRGEPRFVDVDVWVENGRLYGEW